MNRNIRISRLLPVLFSFFVMGFVDVVGISTSYVKADFRLSDKLANLLPMMVFLWFAVCSLPTGALMNRIGRRRTVMLSAAVTFAAMLLPLMSYTFPVVLAAFALLGIGNTILQVSLNPLLTDVTDPRHVTSMLTLGQFIKAVSSTLGPLIAGVAATLWGDWRLIFPVYAAVTLLSWIWLLCVRIPAPPTTSTNENTLTRLRTLLGSGYLLMLLAVIVLSVGFEIGLMTAVPKYLNERCAMPLDKAGLGCSLYYVARTVGTFAGAFVLSRLSQRRFLTLTMLLALAAIAVFIGSADSYVLFGALFALGLLCANVFAIALSAALKFAPAEANAVSALMIMGVAGGALLPPLMGVVADLSSQAASLFVPAAALGCIFFASLKLKTD